MATAETEKAVAEKPPPAVPDYLASPNAVFADQGVEWRYGEPPDYSKTRAMWEETKKMKHETGSLPQLVENLVKNWEVEASFKPRLEDWRTIDHANYTFAINGGPPQTAEHMLKVGTYNAIIAANEYYSPEHSDFASSHKTFKRMMPTFAWEVLEVYSGPPAVAFKWRHWGEMKHDYVGFNDKGEKITAKAHGGKIEIEGVTVAEVDDQVRLRKVETWFDPMEMFRQIAPHGIVNKEIMDCKVSMSEALDGSAANAKVSNSSHSVLADHFGVSEPKQVLDKSVSASTGEPADSFVPGQGTANSDGATTSAQDGAQTGNLQTSQSTIGGTKDQDQIMADSTASDHKARTADAIINTAASSGSAVPIARDSGAAAQSSSPSSSGQVSEGSDKTWEKVDRPEDLDKIIVGDHPRGMEEKVQPSAGEAVVAPPDAKETKRTHEEMSQMSPMECPFLMNRE